MAKLPDKPIFLTGFMATGKTKIGRILAGWLNRDFVDTDELLMESAAKTIPEIFEEDGEDAFRQLEHEAVVSASKMANVIVSLGGGAITFERNWDVIRQTGICLCFQASIDTIFERVSRKRDERPLLAGLNDEELRAKIVELLAEREPFYARADAFAASTEALAPEDTAEMAMLELEKIWRT